MRAKLMYGQPPVVDWAPGSAATPQTVVTTTIAVPGPGVEDPEIVAVRAIVTALEPLPPNARARVIEYIRSRYEVRRG